MKKMQTLSLLAVLSLTFLFSTAHAIKNPYHRFCLPEGYLWTLGTGNKELPLCKIQSAAIGADDIFKFKTENIKSLSIQLFLSLPEKNDGPASCRNAMGAVVHRFDSDEQEWAVCQLQDGSLISIETLSRGYKDEANAALTYLLFNRYEPIVTEPVTEDVSEQ